MQAHRLLLWAAAAACLLAPASAYTWRECGSGAFTVSSVVLGPEPVQPGQTATFKIDATSSERTGCLLACLGALCLCLAPAPRLLALCPLRVEPT